MPVPVARAASRRRAPATTALLRHHTPPRLGRPPCRALAVEALRDVPAERHEAYIPPITKHYSSQGFAPYAWHLAEEAPPLAAPPPKPLAECRLGVLATSGAYVAGAQRAFSYKDDTSLRRIPSDTPASRLHFSHLTENYLVAGRDDSSCLFPLATLRALVGDGVLGSLAPELLSCMGGIYSTRRVREELAPAVVAAFEEQQLDAALLVPM